MGRSNDREDRELDRLRKEVRDLKSTNKSLLRQVKKLSRGYNRYLAEEDDKKEEALEELIETTVEKTCWDCGGNYKKVEICGRSFRTCDGCGKRGKVKKVQASKPK
jgi:hypothetical protein